MQGSPEAAKPKGILKKRTTVSSRDSKMMRKPAKQKTKKTFKTTSKQIDKMIKKKTGGFVDKGLPQTEDMQAEGKKFPEKKQREFHQKKGVKRKFEGGNKGDKGAKKPALETMTYKERKLVRKKTKNNYEISRQAKKIWETVRDSKCPAEKRKTLIAELCELIKGKVAELVFAHDTVRVIQCCVQYGTEEQRKAIFEELGEKVVQLCKSKFGKHYVIKMLRYGTKEQKHQIMSSFHGKVCQLVRNKDAADVVEESYNNFANAQERSALMEEFYGPRFAVFKEKGVHTLDEILKKSPEMKEGILEHMLKLLPSLLEKSVVKHSIVHKALHDFMVHANNAKRAELIATLRDVVVQILHTQDGAKAAMYALWFGSAKDRKIIIKSFKTFLRKICKEEFGHRVLFALFDCVDDTKLVEKAIINEIMTNCKELSEDTHGKKVIMYMLSPRNPSHFHPDIVKLLEKGDDNPTSKKDKELRQREILEAASKPLLQMVVDNVRELVFDKSRSQLALAILKFASGDKRQAFQAIASLAAEDFVPVFTDSADALTEMHIVEHPSGHLLLKRILQHEKSLTSEETLRFSDVLMEIVPIDCLQKWTTVNRGSLVLLSLYESCSDSNRRSIEESLDAAVLAKRDTKGAKALSEKLKGDGK